MNLKNYFILFAFLTLISILSSISFFYLSNLSKIMSLILVLINIISVSGLIMIYSLSSFEGMILVIVFLTGLFILMSYLVSVTPENPKFVNFFYKEKAQSKNFYFMKWILLLSILLFILLALYWEFNSQSLWFEVKFSKENFNFSFLSPFKHISIYMVNILIFLLLFIVWMYMRFTYTKKGGLRLKCNLKKMKSFK
uniref:NADH dehydrogenase subunit 6 n=1 Tax=Heterodoxus macropus TaxID=145266 RepID=Q9B8H0_9NEOP|nr:NADH dehydrogenase subunit 6 [Heterodoxus macropus]